MEEDLPLSPTNRGVIYADAVTDVIDKTEEPEGPPDTV